MPEPVILYDVDPVNPYGRELAAVLAADGRDVTLMCSRAVAWAPERVTARRVLAAPRSVSSLPAVALRRVFGVVVAVLRAARSRAPVVVVWSRDVWDAFVLAVFATVSGRVVVVDHNPTADRRANGLKGRAESWLRSRARVVAVHDPSLVRGERDGRQVVVTHPAYAEWRRRFLPVDPPAAPDRLLLLGAIRADKGAADVAALLRRLPAGAALTVVGKGTAPASWTAAADRAGVRLDVVGGADFVSDERLGAELARGGIVLAPYPGATQSGTVILAVTCSLPVLGYAAGALPSVLSDASLVPVGDTSGLAGLVARYQQEPWGTARVTAADLNRRCVQDWRDVLAALPGKR
jgi:hypothetical protein